METVKDLAIVLRSVAYEERHRIVTALTETQGLVSAMAKNAIQSRRFGGCLEVFVASDWYFTRKSTSDLCHLTETLIREPFTGLRTDFQKLSIASVLNELMLRVAPPGEPCLDLFKLHSNALSILAQSGGPDQPIPSFVLLNAYIAKILQWSGNQPRLSRCLSCGVPLEEVDPSIELSCRVDDAGWVCESCRGKNTRHIQDQMGQTLQQALLKVPASAMMDFQVFLRTPLRQAIGQVSFQPSAHQALFEFLEGLLAFHLPGFDRAPLKSIRFVAGAGRS